MTDAERRLWARIRNGAIDGARFRRQEPIGKFVVDFVCRPARLVVELDGGQHAESVDVDQRRTEALALLGFRVVRFWNNDVLSNLDGVLEAIRQALRSPAA